MEFRVTVGLGQDSADTTVLESRAGALQESLAGLPEGAGAVVAVDLVKATAQLVLVVHAEDALGAAQQALQASGRGLQQAGLGAPGTIVTLEAEAVPAPVPDHLLRPHPVQGGAGGS
jgi:hypothetical protein